jgi:hypothetical protein
MRHCEREQRPVTRRPNLIAKEPRLGGWTEQSPGANDPLRKTITRLDDAQPSRTGS